MTLAHAEIFYLLNRFTETGFLKYQLSAYCWRIVIPEHNTKAVTIELNSAGQKQ